jgi:hypothetical protein
MLERCPRNVLKWDEKARMHRRTNLLLSRSPASGDTFNHQLEQELYVKAGAFLPAPEHLERHPAINKAAHLSRLSATAISSVQVEVAETWRPNATLFDPKLHVRLSSLFSYLQS